MRKDDINVRVFQNSDWRSLKSDRWFFFFLSLSEDLSIGRVLCEKKHGGTGLLFQKTEALHANPNKRVGTRATTSNYSAVGDFLQYIYIAPVAKNHQMIRSGCLVHEISFTNIFLTINHGYKGAILKKNYPWLLPFFMAVDTYYCYEKVRRTMRNAIVSYLVKN